MFACQPARLFLHGSYMCGGMAELWIFDRSGMYSGDVFDVSESPCRFLTVLIGFVLMSDAELGLSTLIKDDGPGTHILCRGNDKTDVEKLDLGYLPMFAPEHEDI